MDYEDYKALRDGSALAALSDTRDYASEHLVVEYRCQPCSVGTAFVYPAGPDAEARAAALADRERQAREVLTKTGGCPHAATARVVMLAPGDI